MKKKKLLFGLLTFALAYVIMFPCVYATNNYTNDDETSATSDFSINTIYEAGTYVSPIEIYNIDLEWDDLHWIFIYSGDITNPTTRVWITKTEYDNFRNGQDSNAFNLTILNNISQYKNHDEVQISITNHSVFAVDITAAVEQKSNVDYTNSSILQVTNENSSNWSNSHASIEGLNNGSSSYFKVKPQSSRFVNDDGNTVSVTGELKLTFTKS